MDEKARAIRCEEYPWETKCYGCERMNYVGHQPAGERVGIIYCGAILTVSGVSEYPSAIPWEPVDRPEREGAGFVPSEKTVRGGYRWRSPKVFVRKPGLVALVISAIFLVLAFVVIAGGSRLRSGVCKALDVTLPVMLFVRAASSRSPAFSGQHMIASSPDPAPGNLRLAVIRRMLCPSETRTTSHPWEESIMGINRRMLLASGTALAGLSAFGETIAQAAGNPEKEVPAILTAIVKAKPGQEDAVKEALLSLVEPTRKEAGCLCYNLHQSKSDPTMFMFYEQWASQKDLDAHTASHPT